MRTYAAALLALACLTALPASAALNAPATNRGDSPLSIVPIDDYIRTDGIQLDAVNLGAATDNPLDANGIIFTANRNANPSGANWSASGPFVASNLEGEPPIDRLFFSEIFGTFPITLTYRNLDPARRYVVQIGHGEPRECCAGRFSNNDFVLSDGTVLSVPSFQLGNGVAREVPPAADDLALVTVEITGVSSFTYTMRSSEGDARGPSISCFQVRDITATTRTVTTTAGSGPGSLRRAIADAANGYTIVFSPAVFHGRAEDAIVLASEIAVIGKTLTMDAGNNATRVLNVSTGGNLTLRGMTITGGKAAEGAGISISGEGATLRMERCTIRDNHATNSAGGLGVFTPGIATLVNCTVANNTAGNFGGGIDLNSGTATVRLIHCTVRGNGSPVGAGVTVNSFGADTFRLENSVIAGNGPGNDLRTYGDPVPFSLAGHNVIGTIDDGAGILPAGSPNDNGNYVGVLFSGLNVLADNGGPGKTCLPLPGSLAIGNGVSFPDSPGLDQRGQRRSGTSPDIGAAESAWEFLPTTPPSGAGVIGALTTPADGVIAFPFENAAPGEESASAIDGNSSTKYLNFERLNTGLDLTPAIGATRLSGLAITSANDEPGRDPVTFVLLGARFPGAGHVPIATGTLPAFNERFQTRTIHFPATAPAFSHYRIVFPTVASPFFTMENDSMQIAEIDLIGAATDPSLRITKFKLNRIEAGQAFFDAVWASEPGAVYDIDVSLNLKDPWTASLNHIDTPSGGAATHAELFIDSLQATPKFFIRIRKK